MKPDTTSYEHIELRNDVPVISGANTKVIEVVALQAAHGLSPEETCLQLPHLSMGQIHSALAYYWDHRESLDADLVLRAEKVERLRQRTPEPVFLDRLRRLRRQSA
jgi:uncharacterized protein (DUF433 family)